MNWSLGIPTACLASALSCALYISIQYKHIISILIAEPVLYYSNGNGPTVLAGNVYWNRHPAYHTPSGSGIILISAEEVQTL